MIGSFFMFYRGFHLIASKAIQVLCHIAHQKRSPHPWLRQPRWYQSLVTGTERVRTQKPAGREEPWISWVGCPYLPRSVPSVPLSLQLHRRLFSRHGVVVPNVQHLGRKESPVSLRGGRRFRRPVALLCWNMIRWLMKSLPCSIPKPLDLAHQKEVNRYFLGTLQGPLCPKDKRAPSQHRGQASVQDPGPGRSLSRGWQRLRWPWWKTSCWVSASQSVKCEQFQTTRVCDKTHHSTFQKCLFTDVLPASLSV